jgi:uncharacterized protein YndB with AHSA1/START domain
MNDIASQIKAIHRQVSTRPIESGEIVSVQLRRTYDASVEDVWEAVTDPARLKRWFLPVSGDLHVGGTFQFEGNAGGEILTCEPPRLLKATWGGPTSLVELRLSPGVDSDTLLEFEHTVPIEMAGSGAGALYVGPGWDAALRSLGLFLRGEAGDDPIALENSPEGREFSRQSVHAWVTVVEFSGTAGPEEIAEATRMSLAQFAPDLAATPVRDKSN